MSGYALTALGMVNALGDNLAAITERLLQGDCSRLSKHALRSSGVVVPAGVVQEVLPSFPPSLRTYQCRNHALALMAFRQIQPSVAAIRQRIGAERLGVVIGSSTSGIDASETAFFQWRTNGTVPGSYSFRTQHEMGSVSEFVAVLAGAKGPAYTVSTACSSSAKTFASAASFLDLDICDAVIVGGVDSLCHLTLNGFESLSSLSRVMSNPMSRNRDGLNIGEGAALFILSREKGPIVLLGVGESSDGHHISAPAPDGRGAEAAIRLALLAARLEPTAIDYVNLHGTGTPQNDAMEATAVARVLGNTPASSCKPLLGHCLGAAGAMEVGLCWLALSTASSASVQLPPHHWDGMVDDSFPKLNLVQPGQAIPNRGAIHFLSNSFGFGGSNCAVVFGRIEDQTKHRKMNVPISPPASVCLQSWAAWSPGLSSPEDWTTWLSDRKTLVDNGAAPPCADVAPAIRRRCGRLVRMVLQTAFQACDSAQVDPCQVHHLYCSRYGELATTKKLFDALHDGLPLSPTLFSGSVHHTPSAYFHLATQGRLLSRAISAADNGLICSLLEVLALLSQHPTIPVLLSIADEPPPEPFASLASAVPMPYAVAFLFQAPPPQAAATVLHVAQSDPKRNSCVNGPDQLFDFLQWVAAPAASAKETLDLGGWIWRR